MKRMRFLLIFSIFCLDLAAQTERFSFGVTGGVPIGPMTSKSGYENRNESKRYTVGFSLEVFLNEHISIVTNPLYKHTGYSFDISRTYLDPSGTTAQQNVRSFGRVRSESLELPVMGRYTFRSSRQRIRPFAGAGFAFQKSFQNTENTTVLSGANIIGSQVFRGSSDGRTPLDTGAVFSAGLSIKQGRIHYVPEFRYTRWGGGNPSHNRNQSEALFTIRF
jgi:hypothetical protein